MSYAGQSPAPFAPLPQGGLPYELQLANAQRQQRLAEQLQQQVQDPIQVQQGGGAPAPISWGSVLAKALQGYNASSKEAYARNQLQQIGQQDNQSAQDLARQLTAHTVGTPSLPAVPGQMDATAPQLPGGPAPAPVSAPASLPATPGGQMGTPDPNAQLATLLSAHGGPQTQMIQQAMIPQILGRQNADYEHTLKRSDLDYQNAMPMSAATGQQIAAQARAQQQTAAAANALPETAYQRGSLAIEGGKLAEDRRYHNLMMGNGMSGDDPAVRAGVAAVTAGNVPGVQSLPKQLQIPVLEALNNAPAAVYAPIAARRFGMASQSIIGPLMKLPQYELTANGLPLIQRMQAAAKTPGSVADQELLDSFTKLSTSGNAITDAQTRIITDGKALGDWASVQLNKLQNGGVLSDQQRKDIREIANRTYAKYKEGYQPLYDEATSKLTAAGIPKPFWTIPDLNKLNAAQTGGPTSAPSAPKSVPTGWTLHQDAKGNKAYVSPDGKQFMEAP